MSLNKKILLPYLLLLLLGGLLALKYLTDSEKEIRSAQTNPVYQQLRIFHKRQDQQQSEAAEFVLLGSSHLQGLNTSLLGKNVLNFGIGGDTTAGLLNRINDYQSVHTASNVVLQIGGNDLWNNDEESLTKNLRELSLALANVKRLIWVGLIPIDYEVHPTYPKNLFKQTNKTIQKLCLKTPNCTYLDPAKFLNRADELQQSLHVGDGIHLNTETYLRWAKAILSST